MIFFANPGGRLGNQIFLFAFLSNLVKGNEIVVGPASRSFVNVFDKMKPGRWILLNRRLGLFMERLLVPCVLRPLSRIGAISKIEQKEISFAGKVERIDELIERQGLLRRIRFVDYGYYQGSFFFDKEKARSSLRIRSAHKEAAQEFLRQLPDGVCKVGVHVRRGDYLSFSVHGKRDVSLPMAYYNEAIEWFRENVTHPFFVFLGDEPDFVYQRFQGQVESVILHSSPAVDLATLCLCDGAVLSNSTFAWWGGFFIKKPVKIFAPKYWLGFKSKTWYPRGIRPDFAELLDPS